MRTVNPANGTVIAEYEPMDLTSVGLKLRVAEAAWLAWRERAFAGRGAVLHEAASILRSKQAELARLITDEMGKPIRESRHELDKCAWVCEYFAEHAAKFLEPERLPSDASASYVTFEPLGVILGIMPWNFPFWQVFRFAAPTLMAGNVVLLKHATNVTGCALAIEQLMREAGADEGVFTTLLIEDHDEVENIVRDPRVAAVSLTGSVRAGQAVGSIAGRFIKPSVLELGGSDPFIVLADADLDAATRGAVTGRMVNSGQSCIAAKRFIVEEAVHDVFVDKLSTALAELEIGDPHDENVQVGPLARADIIQSLDFQVQASLQQGARCVLGGRPLDLAGNFYPPTVLIDVKEGMPVFDEETFGPVAAIVRARDEQEAVRLANSSVYALGASVWTERARGAALAPRLMAGHVSINGVVKSDPRLPFGGMKCSGYGRELSRFGILEFVNIKSVWVG